MSCSCRLPRLKKFFGCLTLETGALIIGWFFVLSSLLEVVIVSILYYNLIDYFEQELANATNIHDNQNEEMQAYMAKTMVDVFIAIMSFGFVVNSMLLIGIYKRNTCLMLPWIMMIGCSCILAILFGLLSLASSFYSLEAVLSAIVLNLSIAWHIYVFLVMYSFYAELNAQRNINEKTPLSASGSSYQRYSVLT